MKYYQELFKLGVFNLEQASNIINHNNPIQTLSLYIKSGLIRKIKRNLYICVDLATGDDIVDKTVIASKINNNSFIMGHTAFQFYGFYNQIYNNCQVGSLKKFKEFEYDDVNYECYLTDNLKQIETIKGVKVTSIERTIVDSIDMIGKVMDLEELLKCIDIIPMVDESKLKEMLLEYDKDLLYRKTGYVLSYFKNDLDISDSFFDFCLEHSNQKNRGKISNYEINELEYIPKWHLYAYKNLLKLISKGVEIDA